MVLLAAIACVASGYFAGRASAQASQPRLSESENNVHLLYDVPSLMPVP